MKARVLLLLLTFFCAVSVSNATPTIGVASNVYAYSSASSLNDEYVKTFAETIVPAIAPAYHGFQIGASGTDLTVFTSYLPSAYDIYFLSNTGNDNFPIFYNGQQMVFTGKVAHQIDGYNNPSKVYYSTLLPKDISLWDTITLNNEPYYTLAASIVYSGEMTPGDHFFACADTNRNGTFDKDDDWSPKTDSAGGFPVPPVPVPEPASLMLFGAGLAGFAVKRFIK